MNKIDKYGLNIHIYLSCAIAFLIPTLPILLPIFIGLICINWLFYIIKNGISLKRIGHNNIAIAMIGFYLINLLGLIITDQSNMRYGWFMVEIKLSFILLPLVFLTSYSFSKHQLDMVLKSFLLGSVLSGTYHLVKVVVEVNTENLSAHHLFGKYFTAPLHLGYYAHYLVFAFLISYSFLIQTKSKTYQILYGTSLALLPVFIFFTTSKAGIIGFFVVLTGILIHWIKSKSSRKKILWSVSTLAIVMLALQLTYNSKTALRFRTAYNSLVHTEISPSSSASSQARLYAWKTALSLFQNNIITGVGTGNLKTYTLNHYQQNGYIGVLKHKLNAPNQFFQTAAATGFVGLIMLLIIFWFILNYSVKYKSILLLGFGTIMFLFAFTESIFERQSGIIFFTFFALLISQLKISKNDSILTTPN